MVKQHSISFGGKQYQLDKWGFLDPPDQWDNEFAEGMAKQQGIIQGLTEDHWQLIKYLRRKFLEEQTIPVVVIACAENKMRLNTLRDLFPTGYHRGACRIAGINYAFMYESNIWLTYETVPAAESEHDTSELGFLADFEKWTEDFASWVARNWDLPDGLTDRHWKIISYLRDYYSRTKNIPTLFEVCTRVGIDLDEFGALFPRGYRRGACRAAGLPFFG